MEPKEHFTPSIQIALFKFAPSKFAFRIFAPVKSASKNSSIPWKYLFIPHDEIKTNISFKKLTDDFTEK